MTFTVEYQSRVVQQTRKIKRFFQVHPAVDHIRCDNPYQRTYDGSRVDECPKRLGMDIQ